MKSGGVLWRVLFKNMPLFFTTVGFIMFVSLFALVMPFFFKVLIDYIIIYKMVHFLNIFTIIIVIVLTSRLIFGFFQDFIFYIYRYKVESLLYDTYFSEVLNFDKKSFEQYSTGDLLTRLTNAVNSLGWFFTDFMFYLFYAILMAIIVTVLLFVMNKILLIGVIVFLILHFINFMAFVKILKSVSDRYYSQKSRVTDLMIEYFDGFLQIITAWQKSKYNDGFSNETDKQFQLFFKMQNISKIQFMFQNILIGLTIIFLVYVCSYQVIDGTMTLGNMTFFALLLGFLYEPIYRLSDINKGMQGAISQLQKLFEIIDHPGKEDIGDIKSQKPIISIALDNVFFSYPDGKTIFSGISTRFTRGNIYLISGPSGCGKSTLFNLLLKLHLPDNGSIQVNDSNYRELSPIHLRSSIAVSLQDNVMFNGSIMENISTFDSNTDQEKVEQAAKIACADLFIRNFKYQYYEKVADDGTNLSGGQKKRINLARTLYDLDGKDVLLLDEPSAGLDDFNEVKFFANMQQLKRDRIIIIISHNLKNAKYCDHVLRLSDGVLLKGDA